MIIFLEIRVLLTLFSIFELGTAGRLQGGSAIFSSNCSKFSGVWGIFCWTLLKRLTGVWEERRQSVQIATSLSESHNSLSLHNFPPYPKKAIPLIKHALLYPVLRKPFLQTRGCDCHGYTILVSEQGDTGSPVHATPTPTEPQSGWFSNIVTFVTCSFLKCMCCPSRLSTGQCEHRLNWKRRQNWGA